MERCNAIDEAVLCWVTRCSRLITTASLSCQVLAVMQLLAASGHGSVILLVQPKALAPPLVKDITLLS